jgi:acylglycerol lipase
MWAPPAASPAQTGARPSLRPQQSMAVHVLVRPPVAVRHPPRLCLAVPPPASEVAAAAAKEEEEWVRTTGAVEMDAAVRRELAIQRLREGIEAEAEEGTRRSRRDFAVFETARGDALFTQSWTPAAADRVKYLHLPTLLQ